MDSRYLLANRYHQALPLRIREYLNGRGISNEAISDYMVGWNGWRITIPILGRDGEFSSFRLAKDPEDDSNSPKMLSVPGAKVELYGWETLLSEPPSIIICEGEFDRLVLESRDFPAVTSTGGAATFKKDWIDGFQPDQEVFICFDNDIAGRQGAEKVAQLLPQAKIVRLPDELGPGGDVTDFFVEWGKSKEDFVVLLEEAEALPFHSEKYAPPEPPSPLGGGLRNEIYRLKQLVPLEQLIARQIPLHRTGRNCVGRCPFHGDENPSFVVYPQSQTFYCFGCQAHGDALDFLMRYEHLAFPEALQTLRDLAP